MTRILKRRIVKKGRKDYKCWWCGHYIIRGTAHVYIAAYVPEQNGFVTVRQCTACSDQISYGTQKVKGVACKANV